MVNQIRSATFVLVVCTENYERRFSGMEETGKGLGVKWEGASITQALYKTEARNTTFIPVLFSSDDVSYIPFVLQGATWHEPNTDAGYKSLYRRLTGQPHTQKLEVGEIQPIPSRERRQFLVSRWAHRQVW